MIHKCALAVIQKRGQGVIGPSINTMDADEESFLLRHVQNLREKVDANQARGRFLPGSYLEADIQRLLAANDDEFLEIAERHASNLAAAMEHTANAKACVLAILTEGPSAGPSRVSLLKLDAEIEAAQLTQTSQGVRLRVLQELLPRPGDMQKGFSWPDPRSPRSTIIVLDKVVAGSSAKYFKDAFDLDVSPKWAITEAALVQEITALPSETVAAAVAAADDGGDAEEVVQRIRQQVPEFAPTAEELGTAGALGGRIRPGFASMATKTFQVDGFELKVPLASMHRVTTRREGDQYVTTIVTDFPLTDPADDDTVTPPF